jgi:hypothetical protein
MAHCDGPCDEYRMCTMAHRDVTVKNIFFYTPLHLMLQSGSNLANGRGILANVHM